QTVYECRSCQDRFLGDRRCSDCNLWCRKVGLGGQCSGCAEVMTVSDLIGFDFSSKEVTHIRSCLIHSGRISTGLYKTLNRFANQDLLQIGIAPERDWRMGHRVAPE